MKNIPTVINAILAAVLVLILLTISLPGISALASTPAPEARPVQKAEPTCNPQRTVNVSGTALVNVIPDRALVQIGVQSNGRTPREVQARNAATISKVIHAVKALGVEGQDISTDRYIIEPRYQDSESLYIQGYRIYNVVAVTLRDVDQTSEVIAVAFEAGANQVVNVEFYTSELRKYRDQAREMAMMAASEKAGALARAAGAETDCVLSINENTWSYFQGRSWWYGGNNSNLWTQNAVQNVVPQGGEPAPTIDESPVSLGHIAIRAEVTTTFSLK